MTSCRLIAVGTTAVLLTCLDCESDKGAATAPPAVGYFIDQQTVTAWKVEGANYYGLKETAYGDLATVPAPSVRFARSSVLPTFSLTVRDPESLRRVPLVFERFGLRLAGNKVSNESVPCIVRQRCLEYLALNDTCVTNDGVKDLISLKNLWALDLMGTYATAASASDVAQLTNLRWLRLPEGAYTVHQLREIAKLTHLRWLSLRNGQLPRNGLQPLGRLVELRSLNLALCDGVASANLTNLACLKSLLHLDLSLTDVGDPDVAAVVDMWPRIHFLSLHGTKMTDNGAMHLTRLRDIKLLNIKGLALHDRTLRKLKRQLPSCRIMSED